MFVALVAIAALMAIDSGGEWNMAIPSCHTNPAVPVSAWLLGVGPLAFYLPVCGQTLFPLTDPTCLIVATVMFAPLVFAPRRWPKATGVILFVVALAWVSTGLLAIMAATQG